MERRNGRWRRRSWAEQDPLTGLASRIGLERRADRFVDAATARGAETVLMLIDVDRFREFNDALGHGAGDQILALIADALRSAVPADSFLARLGGDEFAVLVPERGLPEEDAAARERLAAAGQALLRAVAGPFHLAGVDVDVEVEATMGIAVLPRHGRLLRAALPRADVALSAARRDGDRTGVWTAGMLSVGRLEIALAGQLRGALADGEFRLEYQPFESCRTGRVTGVEALLRWQHPTHGRLLPAAFLPLAERSPLIGELTRWTLTTALGQCAQWAADGLHVPVSVNLSARILIRDDLPDLVSATLAEFQLPPDVLTLEITESALVTQPRRAAAMLGELRDRGVRLSLDDFGTGYSSMEVLKALPVHELKVDKAFVMGAGTNLPDAAIVRSVLELGHRLGLHVVAEGVETPESARLMAELGCDILQGNIISPPLPPSPELRQILDSAPKARDTAEEPTPNGKAANGTLANATGVSGPGVSGPGASGRGVGGQGPDGQARERSPGDRSEPKPVVLPMAERRRVAAVTRYRILDTEREAVFDDFAALAAQICNAPVGALGFVDDHRHWIKAMYGAEYTEIPLESSLATPVIRRKGVYEVRDLAKDKSSAAMLALGARFYAGVPLTTRDGYAIGVISVLDRVPRALNPGQRRALTALARLVVEHLDARRAGLMMERIATTMHALEPLWYPDDFDAATTAVAWAALDLLDADAVSIIVSDLPGSTVFHAVANVARVPGPTLLKKGRRYTERETSGIGVALRTQSPLYIADAVTSPLMLPGSAERFGIGSTLTVPMPGEGGLLGVVGARWAVQTDTVDDDALRAVLLLTDRAGHVIERLRAARSRRRDEELDAATGLVSRRRFLELLTGLPTGTAVVVLGVARRTPRGGDWRAVAEGEVLADFAACVREAADPTDFAARWTDNRFVLAVPVGGRAAAEERVRRLWRAWGPSRAPFRAGIELTGADAPPSAALVTAEEELTGALRDATLPDHEHDPDGAGPEQDPGHDAGPEHGPTAGKNGATSAAEPADGPVPARH